MILPNVQNIKLAKMSFKITFMLECFRTSKDCRRPIALSTEGSSPDSNSPEMKSSRLSISTCLPNSRCSSAFSS